MGKIRANTVATLAAFAVLVLLLTNPARYIESVKTGLLLFANNVLPSLFPFLFLTKFLTMQGACERTVGFFRPVMKLYRCPPAGGYVFFMSILSGYPIGAKVASDLAAQGVLSPADCKKILSFSSTSGPFFVIGTVGALMLGSAKAGWLMLAAHVLSALLAGLLFCRLSGKSETPPAILPEKQYSDALSASVYDSILSVMNIGGFITLFYVLIDMIAATRLLLPANHLLAALFSAIRLPAELAEPICFGIVEITRGCSMLAGTNAPLAAKAICCCFLISFGGLSINAQALTYVRKCGVSVGTYFLQKILHCALSVPIALGLFSLFGV